MSTRPDELTDLFAPPPVGQTQPMGYRQGTVVAFNSVTGQNTINVGGTLLTDLPMLNSTEVLLMQPGAVVGLMVVGSTWAIIGRLVVPNTPDAGTALNAISTQSANVVAAETTASSPYTDLTTFGPQLSGVRVGTSGRLLVISSATMRCTANAGLSAGSMTFEMSGANTVVADQSNGFEVLSQDSAGTIAEISASRLVLLTGLTPGLVTITSKYSALITAPGGAPSFANRNLTAIAL